MSYLNPRRNRDPFISVTTSVASPTQAACQSASAAFLLPPTAPPALLPLLRHCFLPGCFLAQAVWVSLSSSVTSAGVHCCATAFCLGVFLPKLFGGSHSPLLSLLQGCTDALLHSAWMFSCPSCLGVSLSSSVTPAGVLALPGQQHSKHMTRLVTTVSQPAELLQMPRKVLSRQAGQRPAGEPKEPDGLLNRCL